VKLGRWASGAIGGLILAAAIGACQRSDSFRLAILQGDVQEVQMLLKSNPQWLTNRLSGGETPLHNAVLCPRPREMIELLLRLGADINVKGGGFERHR
jgi:hypothetical protein